MNREEMYEAHKQWLNDRFLYFKRLGDERFEERKRVVEEIIREHKFWLGFGKAEAFEEEAKAFLKRNHKCGDDDGIAFSNHVRAFSRKYLIDFDWLFFIVNWLNVGRPPQPDGGVSNAGGGVKPRALPIIEPDDEEPKEDFEFPSI